MKTIERDGAAPLPVTNQMLRSAVKKAIDQFNSRDKKSLLGPRKLENGRLATEGQQGWGAASERAISHRLAVYVEAELGRLGIIAENTPISVDCEYNRHLQGMKTQRIPIQLQDIVQKARRVARAVVDDSDVFAITVVPDIVVHKRGVDDLNLLVLELKKRSNPEIKDYDALKLSAFTRTGFEEYGYQLGFVVEAEDRLQPDLRELILCSPYAHGKQQPLNFGA
jgi:hypothetical protein